MVDSEGRPPHSAAASHHKVSCHHCGQVGCRCCSGLCFVCFCLLCHCHCLRSSSFDQPFLSFFLSLHFLLIVGCRLVPPSLGFLGAGFLLRSSPFLGLGLGLGGAPIPQPRPRQCSHSSASASAMLSFLGIGLGSAPIPRRQPHPWWFLGVSLGGAPILWRRPRQCSQSLASASAASKCSSH
jgi:hypothetical protein